MAAKRSLKRRKPGLSEAQIRQYNYAAARNGWLAMHPHATEREIEAAFREIARKVGV